MKRENLFKVILLFVLVPAFSLGHTQKVHQHIVTQAYELLRMEFPHIDFGNFASYIGSEQDYGNPPAFPGGWAQCDMDWINPYINSGVWREDCSNPYFTDWNSIIYLYNTHFWNSNNNDNSSGLVIGDEKCLNSYQKALAYINGNKEFDLWWGLDGGDAQTTQFLKPDGSTYTIHNHYGLVLKIADNVGNQRNLPDFHKYGYAKLLGYYNYYNGASCADSYFFEDINPDVTVVIPEDDVQPPGSNYSPPVGSRNFITWELLGRIAHLLQDMSVSAHAHLIPHACPEPVSIVDYYEIWCGNPAGTPPENLQCEYGGSDFAGRQYIASTALSAGGIIDMRDIDNPIRYLFYLTNQIALHYPSGSPDGDIYEGGSTTLFGGSNSGSQYYDGDNYSILLTIPGIQDTTRFSQSSRSSGCSDELGYPCYSQSILLVHDRIGNDR